MNPYLERLKARTGQKPLAAEPTEPSKGASVGFDGSPTGRPTATQAEIAQLRALLMRHLGPESPELDAAMAVALRDPAASLRTLRASFPPNCTAEENADLRRRPDFAPYMKDSTI